MLTFLPGSQVLALAGLAAAAAPLVIHILNRQRYRLLDWAAMDFLLEAASRSRSLLQLRDVLLLVLRTAAVALFGLAIARPYFASTAGAGAGAGAVHAVMVIDNSLSMGRERLGGDGTTQLLDDARSRAKEFIDRLPTGSRISVLPLCGPAGSFSFDPRRSVEDAKEAIDAIKVVDRAGPAALAIDVASRALALAPDLPDKRIVFIGDQQGVNWPTDASTLAAVGEEAGAGAAAAKSDGMQVVSVRPPDGDNTWVESLRLEDGIGDLETAARFTVVVRHQGAAARPGTQVTLSIDGTDVATETIDLEPGQAREVMFSHQFDAAPAADRPAMTTVQVSLPPDRLPGDDKRSIVVPVVTSLPVVFADQFGSGGEQPRLNRYGETRHLRRLLAPVVARSADTKALVDVRHVRVEQIDRDLLADVRLAVVAGARTPGDVVPVLREFVEQGGRLVIAAGADFDVEEWNAAGWNDGAGILPLPLTGTAGRLPDEAEELRPFLLDWKSMKDQSLFRVPGATEEELADLYETPLFFKAVTSGVSDLAAIAAADVRGAEERRAARAELAEKISRLARLEAQGQVRAEDREALRQAREALERLTPAWLTWAERQAAEPADEQLGPRVLAAFEGGAPYLASRRIGRGEVVWVSSGLFSPWNNLPRTNAMLLFDRLLRSLLADTLPQLTVDTADQYTLPLPASNRRDTVRVTRPDGSTESLAIEALGGDAYGVTLRDMTQRGVYTLVGTRPDLADKEKRESTVWKVPLAANGPARESQPELLDASTFAARTRGRDDFRWVDAGTPISVDGARVSGQGSWWWLLLAALGCLLAENVVLARNNREAVSPAGEGT